MPVHCEPWPGKTSTVLADCPAAVGAGGAVIVPAWRRPSASAPSPRSSVSRSAPVTAARCSNAVLAVASEYPASFAPISGQSVR